MSLKCLSSRTSDQIRKYKLLALKYNSLEQISILLELSGCNVIDEIKAAGEQPMGENPEVDIKPYTK